MTSKILCTEFGGALLVCRYDENGQEDRAARFYIPLDIAHAHAHEKKRVRAVDIRDAGLRLDDARTQLLIRYSARLHQECAAPRWAESLFGVELCFSIK